MQDVRKLEVWQRSAALTRSVYEVTHRFPARERFGLTQQARRSVVSIASNIAEGTGRQGNRELRQFLHIAMGSAAELECQLMLACDLGFLDRASSEMILLEVRTVRRKLNRLIQRTHQSTPRTKNQEPRTSS